MRLALSHRIGLTGALLALFTFALPAALSSLAPIGDAVAQTKKAPPYQSPMRGQCEAELEKDRVWQAELKAELRGKVHDEEQTKMIKDRKHVVAAYAALWILAAVFIVVLFLRQRSLSQAVATLEADLEKALAEEASDS